MIDTICFFNFFHNGDLFATREFISSLANQLGDKFKYQYSHLRNFKVLKDLNFEHIPLLLNKNIIPQHSRYKFFQKENILYINTWIGAYMKGQSIDNVYFAEGVNWIEYHKIWKYIYNILNQNLNLQLIFHDDIINYIPKINYEIYKIDNVNKFIKSDEGKKKIIISNNEVLSGQSFNAFNYDDLVEYVAENKKDYTIIATKKYETNYKNIIFTDDIINSNDGCDLNEISYLSTFCDVLIGRNSGPFCFMNIKENLNNVNKKIISLGKIPEDNFLYNLKTNANWGFFNDEYMNKVKEFVNGHL